MKIYSLKRPKHRRNLSSRWWGKLDVNEPFNAEKRLKYEATDLSGCYYNQPTETLFLLSHESSRLIEVNDQGRVLSSLHLSGADQFEGVTINSNGELVVVSEPNIVRVYKKDSF